jgi:hypothetical protein
MVTKRLLTVLLVASTLMLAAGPSPAPPESAKGTPPVEGAKGGETSVAGGTLRGQVRVSLPTAPESDRYHAAVAYNSIHHEYLVVWHNTWPGGHRDIYARRLSERGELKSSFAVSAGPHDRLQPAVAYNSLRNEYLVVWMYNANGDGQTYDIWGRSVSYDGAWMGPEFEIIQLTNRTLWSPKVAHNDEYDKYLVVWSAHDATTLVPTDVARALLDGDGTRLYLGTITTYREPQEADVTSMGFFHPQFLVVWREMWSPADGDIVAVQIGAQDGMVWPPVFVVNADFEDQKSPSVASSGYQHFMVVWQHAYPGPCCDWDIRAQLLDYVGDKDGGVLTLGASTDDEMAPRVAARFNGWYMATWQRSTATGEAVWARVWGPIGWQPSLEVASGIAWHYEQPALAAGRYGALIAYEGDSGSNPLVYRHIYGRRWVAFPAFLPIVQRRW